MNCLKLFLMLPLALTVACGGNGNSGSSESDNGANETAVESVASTAFTTPDLVLCDVTGHVKEITQNDGDVLVAKFDKDGKLMNYGSRDRISHVERDEDGRLVSFLGSEWMKVDWEGGLPASIISQYNEETITDKFVRDDDGRIVKITRRYEFVGEPVETSEITYEYGSDSYDSQGNWVKRTAIYNEGNKEVEQRTITYFE